MWRVVRRERRLPAMTAQVSVKPSPSLSTGTRRAYFSGNSLRLKKVRKIRKTSGGRAPIKAIKVEEDEEDEDEDEEDFDSDDVEEDFGPISSSRKPQIPITQRPKPLSSISDNMSRKGKEEDEEDEEADVVDDEKEDFIEGKESQDLQKRRVAEELIKRYKIENSMKEGKAPKRKMMKIEGEFWPNRDVVLDVEFPMISDEVVNGLVEEKKIQVPDPILAAKYLAKQKYYREQDKKMREKLTKTPDRVRNAVPVDELPIEEKIAIPKQIAESFDALGIKNQSLLRTLIGKWSILKPTEVQAIAIPQIMAGKNVFIAAQTGTGKTLAFLLPLVTKLLDHEQKSKASTFGFKRRGQRARVIVIVPTRELVEQTMSVLGALLTAEDFKHMKAYGMAGGITDDKSEHRGFNNGVDFLISTPDRLAHHIEAKHLNLDDTRFVVIDEADTMFSFDSYEESLKKLLRYMDEAQEKSVTPFQYQFIWASATVSLPVAQHIAREWPDAVQAFASNLHKSVEKLNQDFLYGASGKFKERLLVDTLQKHKKARTMVFCNNSEACKYVYNYLHKKDYKATYVTSDVLAKKRHANFKEFAEGKVSILISTDLASRGIDTKVEVDHVILYDFPTNVIDYLHRIGRTARANNEGFVTAFVAGYDQPLVQKIKDSFEQGKSLANVRAVPTFKQVERKIKSLQKKRLERTAAKINPKYLDEHGKLKPIEASEEL